MRRALCFVVLVLLAGCDKYQSAARWTFSAFAAECAEESIRFSVARVGETLTLTFTCKADKP